MLTPEVIDFLAQRKISAALADQLGLRSVKHKRGSVLVFPYVEDGELVNEKFRLLPKEGFWQHTGRRRVFWNVDALDSPSCTLEGRPLVITEGELDALAALESGWEAAVSVPDGAPVPKDKPTPQEELDDEMGRYEYIWNAREKLKRIKHFVIATDDDPPGRRLRDELTRMLCAASCSYVDYPFPCKDLNDVLIHYGKEAVLEVIRRASPCPVRGLYLPSAYAGAPPIKTYSTGWRLLDQHFLPYFDSFVVITGVPQHGKSSFALQLLAQMAAAHGFVSAIFTPEMPVPFVCDKLKRVSGRDDEWLDRHFVFLGSDPLRQDDDEDFTLDWLVERATEAVLRYNVRILLIDPWNELEHDKRRGESTTEYVGRAIRVLKKFARQRQVMVIIVAHPTKMGRRPDGTVEIPNLYDISDSAAWYNKADHGLVVYRHFEPPGTEIYVCKVRLAEVAGVPGKVTMRYDHTDAKFVPLALDTDPIGSTLGS